MTIDLDRIQAAAGKLRKSTDWLWELAGLESIEDESPGLRDYLAEVGPSVVLDLIAELREARAAIERVQALADDLDRRGCLSCSSLTGGDDLAVELREALDGARD
ncbi:hypothetical protein GS885_02360 [Rhodococcus hoagii]|nr:hypothetical protein [Prescottella equi]NKS02668.1 hypothetical protein [Prescottella equi]NKT40013.1 hypothetical protein [Prescottella equi]NKT56876.1 hypothetical protein [Prescottella equi]NKT61608.1 hypothetical protein [Prescottella equi]